jgi:thiol:disulfide interchange protein
MKRLMMLTAFLNMAILSANAQTTDTAKGIRFEQTLKWSEILAKAKAEHKYIFVDCYATWCGPCKLMEADIYPQKEVADLYNKEFISVKIQMDQTPKDDSLTKARYDRAKTFEANYHVDAYPTFLFFDSDGNPVHKVTG